MKITKLLTSTFLAGTILLTGVQTGAINDNHDAHAATDYGKATMQYKNASGQWVKEYAKNKATAENIVKTKAVADVKRKTPTTYVDQNRGYATFSYKDASGKWVTERGKNQKVVKVKKAKKHSKQIFWEYQKRKYSYKFSFYK